MQQRHYVEERTASLSQRVSDAITRFAGSMTFVAIHAVAYGLWLAINLSMVPGVQPFLSTFVLISQNRMMAAAARQSHLDLQINLLAEHELTRLVSLVDAMAQKMGVDAVDRAELQEIEQDVSPEAVLDGLKEQRAD